MKFFFIFLAENSFIFSKKMIESISEGDKILNFIVPSIKKSLLKNTILHIVVFLIEINSHPVKRSFLP